MPNPKTSRSLTRYGNSSVYNTVSIIQAVAELNTEANLPRVASRARMLESRAQRYLVSLVAVGILEQVPGNGRYALGPTLMELGLTALGQIDAVRAASDTLYQLTEKTGIVSLLSVWGSNGATVIKCEQGNPTATTPIREGRNLSLLETATGQVFLAYLPESETGKFLSREIEFRKKAAPGFKGISSEGIAALRAKVKKEGLVRSTAKLGNDALAAPVFNHEGRLTMVLTLFARAGLADLNPSHRPAMKLREAAVALSKRFGAPIEYLLTIEARNAVAGPRNARRNTRRRRMEIAV